MSRLRLSPRWLAVLVCSVLQLQLPLSFSAPFSDGIYALFETSMGNFTARLDFTNSPKTVANFIGLAEGSRAWMDPASGALQKKPYYDGLIFHRVINGFMIQSGSRTGDGTDNPGYVFEDELKLRHDEPGILSMANSGPRSNGGQFFFTLAPTPSLDGIHSVFGKVIEGLQVVIAIGAVETDCSKAGGGVCTNNAAFANRPTTNVVIQHVTIQRVGATAMAFDIHNQGLPTVSSPPVQLERTPAGKVLNLQRERYTDFIVLRSQDLRLWRGSRLGIHVEPPPTAGIDLTQYETGTETKNFFAVTQISYPGPLFVPRDVPGGRIVSRDGMLDITFGEQIDKGRIVINSGQVSGDIFLWTWSQEPYRARLQVVAQVNPPVTELTLTFTNSRAGTFTGAAMSFPDFRPVFQLSGSFDYTPGPNTPP